MRQIIEFSIIVGVGLTLPFIGNLLAAVQINIFPYYFPMGENIEDDLWFFFFIEMWNLAPIVLCITCQRCTVLKQYRYIPICVTYLFLIYAHYVGSLAWPDPFYWLVPIVAPLLSLLVFFIALIFSIFLAWYSGIIDHD